MKTIDYVDDNEDDYDEIHTSRWNEFSKCTKPTLFCALPEWRISINIIPAVYSVILQGNLSESVWSCAPIDTERTTRHNSSQPASRLGLSVCIVNQQKCGLKSARKPTRNVEKCSRMTVSLTE